MLRAIFLLLVLLNLLALVWGSGVIGDNNSDREPQRRAAQFAAEKIRIVAAGELTAAKVLRNCRAFTGLASAEALQLKTVWTEKMPAAAVTIRPAAAQAGYDIAITGLAHAAADSKLAELKKLGFNGSSHVVAENDKRYSVVIASFAERAAADEEMKNMEKKGLRSATVVTRPAAPDRVVIEVRGTDSEIQKLSDLTASLKNASPATCTTP